MRKTEGKRRSSNCAEKYLQNECSHMFADMSDMFRWIIHFWGSRPIPGAWTATKRFITASSVAIRSWTKRMMWMDPRERSISIVFQQAMVEIQNFSKYVKAYECWYVTVTATQKGRGKNRPTDQEILWVLEKNRLISQQFWVLVSVQPPQWAGHPYPTGTVRKPWGCLETPHPSYRPCRPQWSGIKSAKLPANTTRKNRISS